MKKTISMNIHGQLFNIEEDAYEALQAYLESVQQYFRNMAGQEEIIADMEARIAEKFSSLTQKRKQVLTKKDVTTLIAEMGTVEDFAENELPDSSGEDSSEGTAQSVKRFYRNPEDRVIAGVCSGIATYFGIDPIFVRLAFIVLALFYFGGVLLYIILWILMPEAKTSTQKIEMQGNPVTLETISKTIREQFSKKEITDQEKPSYLVAGLKKASALPFHFFQKIFLLLEKLLRMVWSLIRNIFFPLAGIFLAIFSFFSMMGVAFVAIVLSFHLDAAYLNPAVSTFLPGPLYVPLILSAAVVFFVPFLFIFFLGISLIRRRMLFSGGTWGTFLALWFLGILSAGALGAAVAPKVAERIDQQRAQAKEEFQKDQQTKNFDLKDFSKIHISGPYMVEIFEGKDFLVEFTGSHSEIAGIHPRVENGELILPPLDSEIQQEPRLPWCIFCTQGQNLPHLRITLPELNGGEFTQSAWVRIGQGFKGAQMKFTVAEAASVEIKAEELKAQITVKDGGGLELQGKIQDIFLTMAEGTAILQTTGGNLNLEAANSQIELHGAGESLKATLSGISQLNAGKFVANKVDITLHDRSHGEIFALQELKKSVSPYSDLIIWNPTNGQDAIPSEENEEDF